MLGLAVRNLLVRRARTALATLGLVIALLGIIALISVSGGIEALLKQTLDILPGVMVLRKEYPSPALSRLPADMTEGLEQIAGVRYVVPEVIMPAGVVEGRNLFLQGDPFEVYMLLGVDVSRVDALPEGGIYAQKLTEGRTIAEGAREVLISEDAARSFKKRAGETLKVMDQELLVAGVYRIGSLLLDRGLVVSMEVARELSRIPADQVSAYYCELEEGADGAGIARAIEDRFPKTRARTTEETTSDFEKVWGRVDLLLGAIAAIAVVVGAVGIINTMLMSVIERTKEFGILRATGWRRRDVVRLVVLESALLGALGGAIGCTLGALGVWLAARLLPLDPVASPALLATCLGLSVVLGMLGGVYPAWRASRLDPIQAIRT